MKWEPIRSPFKGMKIWGVKIGHYQFVITNEKGEYRASWKNGLHDLKPFGKQPANYIDGMPFSSFTVAEQAVKNTYKQLRAKQ